MMYCQILRQNKWTYGHDNELDDAEMELNFICLSMSSYISNSSFCGTALLTILMHFSVEENKVGDITPTTHIFSSSRAGF